MSCDEYNSARVISKGLCPPVCKAVFEISAGGKMHVHQGTNQAATALESSRGQDIPCQNDYCAREGFLQCVSGRFKASSCWELWTATEFSTVNLWWMVNTLQIFSRAGNGIELVACWKTVRAQDTKSMFQATNNEKSRVHARSLSPATCPKGWGIDRVSNGVHLGPWLRLCTQEEAAEEIKCSRILLCVTACAHVWKNS